MEELAGTYQKQMRCDEDRLIKPALQRAATQVQGQYRLSFPVRIGYSALRYSRVMVTCG